MKVLRRAKKILLLLCCSFSEMMRHEWVRIYVKTRPVLELGCCKTKKHTHAHTTSWSGHNLFYRKKNPTYTNNENLISSYRISFCKPPLFLLDFLGVKLLVRLFKCAGCLFRVFTTIASLKYKWTIQPLEYLVFRPKTTTPTKTFWLDNLKLRLWKLQLWRATFIYQEFLNKLNGFTIWNHIIVFFSNEVPAAVSRTYEHKWH